MHSLAHTRVAQPCKCSVPGRLLLCQLSNDRCADDMCAFVWIALMGRLVSVFCRVLLQWRRRHFLVHTYCCRGCLFPLAFSACPAGYYCPNSGMTSGTVNRTCHAHTIEFLPFVSLCPQSALLEHTRRAEHHLHAQVECSVITSDLMAACPAGSYCATNGLSAPGSELANSHALPPSVVRLQRWHLLHQRTTFVHM